MRVKKVEKVEFGCQTEVSVAHVLPSILLLLPQLNMRMWASCLTCAFYPQTHTYDFEYGASHLVSVEDRRRDPM